MPTLKKDQLKTAGVIVLLVAGYVLFIHRPGIKQRDALRAEAAALEQQIAEIDTQDLRALQQNVDTARERLEAECRTMPAEQEAFLVFDGVTKSLEGQGISNLAASQSDPREFADYTVQPIYLEFEGDFEDAFAALQAIEQMDHPVRIDRLELIGDTHETSGYVVAVVQLSAFLEGDQP
ncbi:MAG: type 4a pilus biogenesis protein PilO [Planctomycetota bacterium]